MIELERLAEPVYERRWTRWGPDAAGLEEGLRGWQPRGAPPPRCERRALSKSKPEYGGGYYCFPRRGGCGEKFSEEELNLWDEDDEEPCS